MRVLALGGAVLAVLAFAAAAAAKERVRLNAADTAAARAVLITRPDLRPLDGWTGGAVKPDVPEYTCPYYHPKDTGFLVTGSAENDWNRPDRVVQSTAAVLQTARMVHVDFKRSVTAAAVRCAFVRGGAKRVVVSPISFPKLTADTAAFRVTFVVGSAGGDLPQVLELAAVGHGRTEITAAEAMRTPAPLATLHADVVRLATIMNSRAKA